MSKSDDISDRFWSKVVKRGPDDCWEWQACRNADGYGTFLLAGKLVKAHRLSLALSGVAVGVGAVVRHRCDNPPCVNPDHLETGTHADNIRDRTSRGRTHTPKLNTMKVAQIRAWLTYGFTQTAIASWFGIDQSMVSLVASGKAWAK